MMPSAKSNTADMPCITTAIILKPNTFAINPNSHIHHVIKTIHMKFLTISIVIILSPL